MLCDTNPDGINLETCDLEETNCGTRNKLRIPFALYMCFPSNSGFPNWHFNLNEIYSSHYDFRIQR